MPEVRLIDANAIHAKILEENRNNYAATENVAQILLRIETAPTIEPEVRHGQWYEFQCFSEHGIPMASYECTNCGNDIERQRGVLPAYCEFCGAKMGGADNG